MSTNEPIGPQLTALLNQYQNLTLNLFSSLSTLSQLAPPTSTDPSSSTRTSSTASSSSSNSLYTHLSTLSHEFQALLALVHQHTAQKVLIHSLLSQLASLDQTWTESLVALSGLESSLQPLINQGKLGRAQIDSASDAELLTCSNVLTYARRVAPFTSAPPSQDPTQSAFNSGASLLASTQQMAATSAGGGGGLFLPFPTEQAMRRGRLQLDMTGAAAGFKPGHDDDDDDDVGVVGEVGSVGMVNKAPTMKASTEPDASKKLINQAKLDKEHRHHRPPQHGYDDDDFTFDLDLNPDM
ncbi:BZ3500_MvSof-1268-A1-R1_Chr1-1g01092 [Microbotryum saponariae]|uniref:Mediator of RNA polymerase II transcription subunit 4 n=1 Tax=Microbotryum saponariae TaxID=289078 RepID=A0A2X0K8A6_9BASI|nr:BZ3500_MvSof-1268-A1-R1_Chr1-1g01092 [Microbotryum saponariae]SCZ93377.1 BZ3501_MvSof-1269-A2-R1_Chr1-1g00689 [Microbotryum saponariae]